MSARYRLVLRALNPAFSNAWFKRLGKIKAVFPSIVPRQVPIAFVPNWFLLLRIQSTINAVALSFTSAAAAVTAGTTGIQR